MMKLNKGLMSILLGLALLAVLPIVPHIAHAATDGCTSPDGHNWVHFNTADCTSGGTDYYQCSNCYVYRDEKEVGALGHSWGDWSTRMEPTCIESGTRYRQCSRCGVGETDSIPAKGHSPMRIAGVSATCTAGGKTEGSKCSVCGTILTAQSDTAALGHSWDSGTVTTAASCTAEGTKTFKCTRCGETRTESIAKTAHTPVSIPGVSATCTAGGKTEGSKCSICGTILTAQQDTPALGHSWDNGTVTTAASCTAEGVKTFKCTRCGATRTEAIAKTGHSPVSIPGVAATCTSGGKTEGSKCSVCGTILTAQQDTAALGHTPETIPAVAATCTAGGKTEGSKCSVCGAILTAQRDTAALGHTWDKGTVTTKATCTADGVKTFKCTRCGVTRTESIAKTGHTPETIPAVAATCTVDGKTEGSKCSTCGEILTAQTDTPALGHAWDQGKVTQETTLLSGGKITRTCTRCGAAWTEELPVKQSPFNLLRLLDGGDDTPTGGIGEQIAEDFDLSDVLRVVTQPQGGMISQDGSFTLTTEVAGGVPPYTYEWHRDAKLMLGTAGSGLTSLVQSRVSSIASSYSRCRTSFASAFKKTRTGSSAAGGTGKSTYSYGTAMYERGQKSTDLSLGDRNLGSSDSPDYPATAAGSYYCVIRDSAGQWVSTEKAEVSYSLYIASQPRNANLYERYTVTLTCMAAGGNPFGAEYDNAYAYYWFDSQGNNIGNGQQIEVDQEGEYYCIAEDASMAQVTSEKCTVYSQKRHSISMLRSVYLAEDPEDVKIYVNFVISDGSAPYTCYWYKDTELLESFSAGADVVNVISVFETGSYKLEVYDASGDLQTAACKVVDEVNDLVIHRCGAYGSVETGKLTVHIAVGGGLPPYTYTLYHDGKVINQSRLDHPNIGISATEPGDYYFLVEDYQGSSVESSPIRISADGNPTIIQQPESVELEYQENGQYSTRLICKAVSAMGNEEEVWYEWQRHSDRLNAWRANLGNGDFFPASEPGLYRCKVTDTETGAYVYSDTVKVGVKLEVEKLHIDITKDVKYYLTGQIKGGIAPYTLVIHTLRVVDQVPNENNTYDDVLLDTASSPLTFDSAVSFREYLTNKITYDYYFKSKGSYLPQNAPFFYYIVLTDSVGTVYESKSESGIVLSRDD